MIDKRRSNIGRNTLQPVKTVICSPSEALSMYVNVPLTPPVFSSSFPTCLSRHEVKLIPTARSFYFPVQLPQERHGFKGEDA